MPMKVLLFPTEGRECVDCAWPVGESARPVSRSAFLLFLAGHPSHVPGRYHQM